MKIPLKFIAIPVIAVLLSACDDDNLGNIVQTAEGDGSFSTLITALEATGLDVVLEDESRDFTLFAPTDAAFAKLDPALLTSLLSDPDTLSDILLYHVLADTEVDSSAAVSAAGTTVTTANSDDVGVALRGSDLFINSSQVIDPDISASNGIIHAIDTVLIPTTDDPASGNIAEVATAAGTFSTLLGALATTGLDTVLTDSAGKFTVFAPTDDAFAKLPAGTLDNLLKPENKAKLQSILTYHVVSGRYMASDVIRMNSAKTVNGQSFAIGNNYGKVMIDNAKITKTDIMASNGVIHVIDSVILPKDM